MGFRIGQDVWVQGGSKQGNEDAAKVIEIDTTNGNLTVNWSVRGGKKVIPTSSVRPMYDETDKAGSSRRSRRVSTKPDRLDGAFKNEKYGRMSMNKLKAICEKYNLPKTGDKGTLIYQIVKKEEEEIVTPSKTTKLKRKKVESKQSKKLSPPVKKGKSTNKKCLRKQVGPVSGVTVSSNHVKTSDCKTVGLDIRRRRNNIESYFRAMQKSSDIVTNNNNNTKLERKLFQSPECSSEVDCDDDTTAPYPENFDEVDDDDDDDKTVYYPNSDLEIYDDDDETVPYPNADLSSGVIDLVRDNENIQEMIRDVKNSSDLSSETQRKMLAIMESQNVVTTKLLTMLHDNSSSLFL